MSRALYHVTPYANAANILTHDYFRATSGQHYDGLSTTTDEHYWWGSKEVRFALNEEALARDYELVNEHETIHTPNGPLNESEVVVLSDGPILQIHRYVVRIDYYLPKTRLDLRSFKLFVQALRTYVSRYKTPTNVLVRKS